MPGISKEIRIYGIARRDSLLCQGYSLFRGHRSANAAASSVTAWRDTHFKAMKAIITKYALTSGIKTVEGTFSNPGGRRMLSVGRAGFQDHFHGSDFHDNQVDARKDLLKRRQRKIKSFQCAWVRLDEKYMQAVEAINAADLK